MSPTCTTRNVNKLSELIIRFDIALRYHHPNAVFHSFGVNIRAVKKAITKTRNWYSFDSTAYYYFHNKKVNGKRERTTALLNYIDKLRQIGVEV